ncbi:exocyst complex component EXO84A [Euphorbia lathyris]|uniref:exocyst complex component EXO84A n=1 Tax=Euphorbia lathyris TaxID=212925 RepID=UPI0033142101
MSSVGDLTEIEENQTLSDRLKLFKSSKFDPDSYVVSKCTSVNEKEIRHVYSTLGELKKASAEEMRKCVFANYSAFIRTSKEILALEGHLLSMRNLLSTQAALIHGLGECVRIDSLWDHSEESLAEDLSDFEIKELSKGEDWLIQFLETLDVLLAEKRVDEAMEALEQEEKLTKEASRKNTLSPTAFLMLQSAIKEQRQRLADQLADTISQPSTRGAELRASVLALKKLGDGPRAHTLLFISHQQKLKANMRGLRLPNGGVCTAALAQLFFSTIAQAATDSLAVFGEEAAYMSELVTWAVKRTEVFSLLLKRNVVASSASARGLRVASECIQICLGHCSLLEARGLTLSPILLRTFKSSVEQALISNLKRIEQTSAALAAADDWFLAYQPVSGRYASSSLGNATQSQQKLSSSANRFNSMVQELLEDVAPLESLQLDSPAVEGVLHVFNSYVNLLIRALPGSVDHEDNLGGSGSKIVSMAETETQQLALLANASLLADELLPRAFMKLLPLPTKSEEQSKRATNKQSRVPDQRELKRKLQRSADRLRDSFCRLHALELIFTEDGDSRLNANIYLPLDDHAEEPEWFPSPIFQEFFLKLTQVASIVTDMFVGREKVATVLLMRLTETVVLWLSEDQAFWEEVEAGSKPLGPFGLQQFYLDMEFVLLFASEGRYLSRNLHQAIKNIITRAIDAVSATGVDPERVLPEDEWFAEVAQIAIKMLTGKGNFDTVEQGGHSPTGSQGSN